MSKTHRITRVEHYPFRYDPIFKFFCAHSACGQLMDFYGIKNAFFHLNCSFDIEVTGIGKDSAAPFISRMDTSPVFDSSLYQFWCETGQTSCDEIRRINAASIAAGQPVILGVDQFYLPYHCEFGKKHGAHAVILYGFDCGHAFLLDQSENNCFKGKVNLHDLECARRSENSWNGSINTGGNIKYASIVLRGQDIEEATLKHVKKTIRATYQKYYLAAKRQPGAVCGSLCVEFFKDYIRNVDRRRSYNAYFMYLYAAVLPLCAKKSLFQVYLERAAQQFCGHGLAALIENMRAVNKVWGVFLKVLLKSAHTTQFSEKAFCDLLHSMDEAIQFEKNLEKVFAAFL